VHYAVSNCNRSTVCGWPFASARKKGPGPAYTIIPSLLGMPGSLCVRIAYLRNALLLRGTLGKHMN
jgi:hypothetical protein